MHNFFNNIHLYGIQNCSSPNKHHLLSVPMNFLSYCTAIWLLAHPSSFFFSFAFYPSNTSKYKSYSLWFTTACFLAQRPKSSPLAAFKWLIRFGKRSIFDLHLNIFFKFPLVAQEQKDTSSSSCFSWCFKLLVFLAPRHFFSSSVCFSLIVLLSA